MKLSEEIKELIFTTMEAKIKEGQPTTEIEKILIHRNMRNQIEISVKNIVGETQTRLLNLVENSLIQRMFLKKIIAGQKYPKDLKVIECFIILEPKTRNIEITFLLQDKNLHVTKDTIIN